MKHKRLTLLLATLLLTGCTGTAQVQNRAFVQLLGADADRNANRVTAVSFGMEEPASGTGRPCSPHWRLPNVGTTGR